MEHPSAAVAVQLTSKATRDMIPQNVVKVLIIYTGGTIGMKNTPQHGYIPAPGFLARCLALSTRFHDPSGYAHAFGFPERSVDGLLSPNVPLVETVSADGNETPLKWSELERRASVMEGQEWPLFNAVNIPTTHSTTLLPASTSLTSADLPQINGTSYFRSNLPALISPASLYGKRTLYSVLEYDPLLDSAEMTMSDWVKIAIDVECNYGLFDAFIVLHGTDTMSYTASALSFLLEDLGKPVILTGSQIPLSELRNDAAENLLGALTVASHFNIAEVGLFFDNKLFRGNRTSKVDTVGLGAFASPNMQPLVELGVDITVNWPLILRPTTIRPFRAHKRLSTHVASLRIFPGLSSATVRAFLGGDVQGVVMESYGAGNAPTKAWLDELAKGCARGVVVVNTTQCAKGTVTDIYATGKALTAAGVVPGADMTPECALAKLSYLLSKSEIEGGNLVVDDIRQLLRIPLRGELTPPPQAHLLPSSPDPEPSTFSGRVLGAMRSAAEIETAATDSEDQHASTSASTAKLYATAATTTASRSTVKTPVHASALVSVLACRASAAFDAEDLQTLAVHHNLARHANQAPWDGRTALHVAASVGAAECVQVLLENGSSVYIKDVFGRTPLSEAMEGFLFRRRSGGLVTPTTATRAEGDQSPDWEGCVVLLRRAGAHFVGGTTSGQVLAAAVSYGGESGHVNEMVWRTAASGDLSGLQLLVECGADPSVSNSFGQTALHLASQGGHAAVVRYLAQLGRNRSSVQRDSTVNGRTTLRSPESPPDPHHNVPIPSVTTLTPIRVPSPVARLQGRTPPPQKLPPSSPLDLSQADRWGRTAADEARLGVANAQTGGDVTAAQRFLECVAYLEGSG
ncbi:asparaginase-domain-containing protein [Gonapodya prolifera JEL478]|uniref:asparaginase n=1 Tax=Gonapodya prolifera (strain JEL478) TaxID=1344416 RepID=A0A139AG31_GONPJ|nr:asparaginase-domain-containing protein [Gonapodya prolifera JEL478]|eukprot:KXS15782.1 asparaginase-domain-containing protein [Gonapodya prolifera JEL478]